MRLIKISAPAGKGSDVMKMAFSVGIDSVSLRQVETHHKDGKVETKDVVDIETATPKAKIFVDRFLAAPFYNPEDFTLVTRAGLSIVSSEPLSEITRPIPEIVTDITEELFQFSHITYSFVGRIFIAGCLLAYGMIQQNLLLMIAGLLFTPILPLLQAIEFGALTRAWKLALHGLAAFVTAIILLIAAGAAVAGLSSPPLRFQDFSPIAVGVLISLGVGTAAGLAIIDDSGKREMIGLAASATTAIIPVWIGISLVFGFQSETQTEITNRLISFFVNVAAIIISALAVHILSGAAKSQIGKANQ